VVPTVVVDEEDDSSVEVLASVEKKERDQAEGAVDEPVPEAAEMGLGDQSERTAEPDLEMVKDRSGEASDMMEVEVLKQGNLFLRRLWREQGLCLFGKQERVIFPLRINPEMILRRWGSLHLRKPPKHHLPLSQNALQKHPLVLN